MLLWSFYGHVMLCLPASFTCQAKRHVCIGQGLLGLSHLPELYIHQLLCNYPQKRYTNLLQPSVLEFICISCWLGAVLTFYNLRIFDSPDASEVSYEFSSFLSWLCIDTFKSSRTSLQVAYHCVSLPTLFSNLAAWCSPLPKFRLSGALEPSY